jgi:hypothetical protein
MRNRRRIGVALLASIALASLVSAQERAPGDDDAKAQDIRKLLALTGSIEMGEQILDQILAIQRSTFPEVPDAVWTELRASFDFQKLLAASAAIWDKHFTHEDIMGLIEFHESPLGQKLREKQPQILAESMTLGQAWGQKAVEQLIEKLRERGYEKTASRGSARMNGTDG